MARTRSLKPEFFTDAALGELSPLHRLLFEGLWCHADREGRLEDKPKDLKVKVLPFDACDINQLLEDLATSGRILRYIAGGKRLIWVVHFPDHQRPHRDERPSVLPAPTEPIRSEDGDFAATPVFAPKSPGEHGDFGAKTPGLCCGSLVLDPGACSPRSDAVASAPEPQAPDEAEPPDPPPSQPQKRRTATPTRQPDPRHGPLVEALTVVAQATDPGWRFSGGRDAKAVQELLAIAEPAEVEARWQRALRRTGFPEVRTLPELVKHWAHFPAVEVKARGDPRKGYAPVGDWSAAALAKDPLFGPKAGGM